MSFVDDTRKLLQDLVAPELRAVQVQVSSLEKTMEARFAALEKTVDTRFAAMNDKMDAEKESLQADNRVLSVTLNSNLALITRTLQDIDNRLQRMEREGERRGSGGSSSSPVAEPRAPGLVLPGVAEERARGLG